MVSDELRELELGQVLGFGVWFGFVDDLLQADLQQDGGVRTSRVVYDLSVRSSFGGLTCLWLRPLLESLSSL